MKKTLIALAALATVGAASAQVTLYGAVDASYNYKSSGSISNNSLGNSQLGSSKLGFMGTEDLGGGLSAFFKLEGGLANDTGNGKTSNTTNNSATGAAAAAPNGSQGLDFQRYSYVGLKGGFGEARLGRAYIMSFENGQGAVDPFGTNGPADSTQMFYKQTGTTAGSVVTNVSNTIGYYTPSFGGFNAGVQIILGETNQGGAGAYDTGSGYSGFASYSGGPLFVTLAASQVKYAASATDGDYSVSALSASYDFGVAKLAYTYAHEEAARAGATPKSDENLIGVSVPMGALNLKASYVFATKNAGVAGATDNKGNLFGLGVDYSLSKSTKLYATYATVNNSDGGTYATGGISDGSANPTSNQLAIGVYTKF